MSSKHVTQQATWGGYSRSGSPSAVHDCYYQCASNDPNVAQLWAYTGAISYAAGNSLQLYANTTAATYNIEIYRDGAQKTVVFQQENVAGAFHATPVDCSVEGCNWPVSLTIPVAKKWASGGYVICLTAISADGTNLTYEHIFMVRPDNTPNTGRVLLVGATGTWAAYNDWGGSNHYEGITGPNKDQFSPKVSHLRPYAQGFVRLPDDAPRIPLRNKPAMGAAITYPHMEWAYANGYSKKYASAGWAYYERPYLHWLENAGYQVDIIAQQDLQFNADVLQGYDCVTFVGHDEYWSWEMRDTVEAYVKQGGNVARFGGNFLWQTRLQDGGNTQICYKYIADDADPVKGTAQSNRITNCWDAPEIDRAGAKTFGLSGTRGIYAGWGGCCPRGAGGFTVYRPEHWAFEGADIYYGDILGADAHIFGYEVDGVDYIIREGLPYATGSDGAPDNLQILALGLATLYEADHGNGSGSKLFIGDDDAAFVAKTLHGKATPELMERYKRGAGMIATFENGKGCVFNAGSGEWVAGLIECDPQVEVVTKNVLNRFLGQLA